MSIGYDKVCSAWVVAWMAPDRPFIGLTAYRIVAFRRCKPFDGIVPLCCSVVTDGFSNGAKKGSLRVVDTTDLKLIRILQEHPRASYAEIARLAEMNESTTRRRVESLFASGVITPAVIPNIRELGYEAVILIGIKVELKQIDAVAETLRSFPEITMLLVTLGRYDIFIAVAFQSVNEIHDFIVNRVALLPGVKDTEAFVSTSTLKNLRDWRVPNEAFDEAAQPGK
jgi:DNA-binding Lrp family transcriptional regulator